jgi:hypothetical protein
MGLYLVAAEGAGTRGDPRRPKYIPALGVDWTAMDFGAAPVFLVEAPLATLTETTLDLNADFFTVPALDSTLTAGQVTAVKTRLEALGVPAGWVTTALTWRQVLRTVASIFQLAQRANVTITTTALDLRMNQIPAGTLAALQDAADSLGFDRSGILGTTTVRQALKALADQWSGPLMLGSVAL